MKNLEMIEKETEELFNSRGLNICIDGKSVMDYIENAIGETGLDDGINEIEDEYFIDNKKYIVFYEIRINRVEVDEDEWDINIQFLGIRFAN